MTPADVVALVVGTRKRHPTWGPRKLKAWITNRGYDCSSASTIGAILSREGYIAPRRRKQRTGEYSDGLTLGLGWCVFRLRLPQSSNVRSRSETGP